MSLEDPFFVVKEEVLKALTKCRDNFERWTDFLDDPNSSSKEEMDFTTTELRNGLRSIEWDLEDLEETVDIVEKNHRKFKLDEQEVSNRRKFIHQTKDEVKFMREKLFDSKNKDKKSSSSLRQSQSPSTSNPTKYTRLDNSFDLSPNRANGSDSVGITVDDGNHLQYHQQMILQTQDDSLDKLRNSVGNLKSISRQIGTEVDEHAVMLDEMGHEIEITDSRLDTTLKKVARVLHLSNDRRQWVAIGLLIFVILIIFLVVIT
ncbi:unnamed protein product [Oppiella nova]|uniref:t-SNARE coiled-coil homology domain-containing protein n=1 Tax=Oppiella nova TaxID=334625 RepID=A0A7R9LHM6_9ACAR|nr:unnamed protein product [Oppiella nova]CAG2163329.1 unnamed protein product [Oppiella nova]